MKRLLFLGLAVVLSLGASAQRVTDRIDRGVVAVSTGSGNFVSWRMMGEEYYDTQYNLYRDGTKVASNLTVTNYQDAGGSKTSTYQVEAVIRGQVQEKSTAAKTWANNYLAVPVKPVVNRSGKTIGNSVAGNSGGKDTTTPGYTINDISLADVDGDGVCEFIMKRNNNQGNLLSASNKTDFNLYECYKIDGTRLWWIDLGPNLMAGADEQWDMIGYDWDEDGKAEMIMRGADNMIIHTAMGKTINIGSMTAGFGSSDRPEYMGVGKEYLLYINGETGEPYGWDGSENWTPMDYPLPQFEADEPYGNSNIWGDLGHRMQKHYFGAPYLDGRHASIFLGRGCYTRHKFCALDVNPQTHELTQRWRWNCYDPASPWFGNGFHNFQIADVDMDGRDEIMFGSMTIDDTGYGLATTGLGHGDAQHCGDLDPYRWGLEQFTCQEGSQGNSYWNATTGQIYYRKSDGGDDGRSLAGNFTNDYPGGQGRSVSSGVIGLSSDKIINTNGDAMSGSYANLNMRIFWDGDLLDEIFNCKNGANRAGNIFKWGGAQIASFAGIGNNWTKCNPSAQGDIIGDWREEVVLRDADNSKVYIYTTTTTTQYGIYTLWHDHQYRNAMAWQCIGYNQPPRPSFFLGELEKITVAPPPLILRGRTELQNGGTIGTTEDHLLISGYEDQTFTVADDANPYILTVNTPAWVQGSGSQQATASTPKSPARTIINYKTTLQGGAFTGDTRLVKQGEGILVLPAVEEKHTGRTDVWNGTLQFDGIMKSSPVWLNRHTTLISNGGQFLGGLQADYNATIYPGGQDNIGSLTVSTLTLGFGSRVVFDCSTQNGDAQVLSTDQLNVSTLVVDTRDWQFGPKYKTPVFQFVNADVLPAGSYELGSLETLDGKVDDILVEGISGKRFYLQHENGKLLLVLEDMRQPTTIVWNGTPGNNIWDLADTENFLADGQSAYAAQGDDIIFNDDATTGNVVVKGAVRPGSITFNNDVLAYTLSGDSILGGAAITKNGKAKVTINNENRTGWTTVNGGTLSVNALANITGITYGALGDVDQRVILNDGTTFQVTQPVITDQPFYVAGDVSIDVPSGLSLTYNKGLKGGTAVVTKTGAGSLTLGTTNTFSKLIVKQGRVNSVALNNVDQLPVNVEFQGGTLWGANMEDTPGITNTSNFIVPSGKTGTFYGSFRGVYTGKLTGEGTFNVYTGGVRCYFDGDWSEFSGTIKAYKENRQNKKSYDPVWAFRNSKGLPKATLNTQTDVHVSNEGKNLTIGSVTGTGILDGSGTYTIGSNDKDFEAAFTSTSPIVKVGTGTMYVYNPGGLTKTVLVKDGLLSFDVPEDKALFGGTLTLEENGAAIGSGLVSSIILNSGTKLTPRSPLFEDMFGGGIVTAVVKSSATMRFNEGSTLEIYILGANEYSSIEPRFLNMNGTLKVVLGEDYQPKAGDTFTIWKASSTYTGTPAFELPELPEGLYWVTSGMAAKEGVLSITDDASQGIGLMAADTPVVCEVYTMSGIHVTTVNAVKGNAAATVRRMPLAAGTYVVKMHAAHRVETVKVVIK